MSNFFSVKTAKSGKNKVSFSKQGLVQFLKDNLGFRFAKIGKKGYFLKEESENTFNVVSFSSLKEDFLANMETNADVLGELNFSELKQAFLQKMPIKNEDYLTDLLSKDFKLSEENFHELSMKYDEGYQSTESLKKISSFMEAEGFTILEEESKDYRFPELFCYKKLNETQYIVLHREFANILPRETKFDLWTMEAREESWFLRFKMEYPRKSEIKLDFKIEEDMELYKAQF